MDSWPIFAALLALTAVTYGLWSNRGVGVSRSTWERFAERRGLPLAPPTPGRAARLAGKIDGYPVEITLFGPTTVTIHPRLPLPRALRIDRVRAGKGSAEHLFPDDPLLGSKLIVRSEEAGLLPELFAEPAAQRACWSLVRWRGGIEGDALRLQYRGRADEKLLDVLLDEALDAARGLDAASLRLWRRRGEEAGLTLHDGPGGASLYGKVCGAEAAVFVEPRGLVCKARIPGGGPAGLLIYAGSGGAKLDDAVLDGALAVETADLPAARELLRQDATRSELLAVIRGYTGSTVEDGAVWLRVPLSRGDDLAALVREAAALAARLGGLDPNQGGAQ